MKTDFLKSHRTILLPSLAILLVHFINNAFTTYGIFRDELYYIACSEHLAWGYVDQPPLCAFLLKISRSIFGDSIFAIRIIPSAAHEATVFLAGAITKKFGGEKFAQLLSSVSVALAPGIVGMMGIYTMNAIDILLWQVVIYFVIRLFETKDVKYWYWIGFAIGLGLLNKISMGWLAAGLAIGFLVTPERKMLKNVHPWIAAGIATLLFLPYVVWNIQHDFAHLEFANNAARLKYASQNPITFFSGLFLLYNPLAIPVWLSGFWILMKHKRKEFRVIGISVLTVLSILLINFNSKSEYFNPAAIILLAAGAIQIEEWFRFRFRMIRNVYVVVIIIT
ncbi:MAG: glycosyltransferase family 39 protein, partial [Ignavibacteriales bacterium]|nr:glycosyltransferase family 39 protein [Ignavibacteriales bacterium]